MNDQLTPNELAFIALTNEYCQAIEEASDCSRTDTLEAMLKLLPRIYIVATDLSQSEDGDYPDDTPLTPALDENTYDRARADMALTLGEDDVFLETMVEDMRYSDTPVSATVSESLADLYQEFFNLMHSVQDMLTDVQRGCIATCIDDFRDYWGQTLCNVLRALHMIHYSSFASHQLAKLED